MDGDNRKVLESASQGRFKGVLRDHLELDRVLVSCRVVLPGDTSCEVIQVIARLLLAPQGYDKAYFRDRQKDMTPASVIHLAILKSELPPLEPHDRDYVMAYAVALETCGIPGDAAYERNCLEKLFVQFGWRLGYCRYVEQCIAKKKLLVSYEEWRKKLRESK